MHTQMNVLETYQEIRQPKIAINGNLLISVHLYQASIQIFQP